MAYVPVKFPWPGINGLSLVEAAARDGVVTALEPGHIASANKAVGNGYLRRDRKGARTYYPTERGRALLIHVRGGGDGPL